MKKRVNAIPTSIETLQYFVALCRKMRRIPEKGEFLNEYKNRTKNWVNVIHLHFGKWKTVVKTAADKYKYVSQLLSVSNDSNVKINTNSCLKKAYQFCKENHRYPSEADLWTSLGIDLKTINTAFGSFDKFKQELRSEYKKELRNFVDRSVWSNDRISSTRQKLSKSRVLFCTSAVAGSEVHEGFYESIMSFCHNQHAELVVFPINGELNELDERFIDASVHVAFGDVHLTNRFMLSAIKIRGNQIDPSTSIHRSIPQGMSAIYAATKQRMTVRPASKNVKDPPYALGTGCVTLPHYVKKPSRDKKGNIVHTFENTDDRLNYIATKNHMMGGVVVEIDDDGTVFTRVVQAYSDGSFADRNIVYGPKGIEKDVAPAAIILGDIHTAQNDTEATDAFLAESKRLKIKTAVVHDIFDGFTINHHQHTNIIRKSQVINGKMITDLKEELVQIANFIKDKLFPVFDNIIIVKSNHDNWLDEYIRTLTFREDPQNLKIGLELALAMYDNCNPLERFVADFFFSNTNLSAEDISRIKFLDEGEDYIISGVNVGHHGHRAANGARGSMKGLEQALPVAFTANIHTPEIFARHHRVGCLARRDMDYTTGSPATSWMYTSGYLHEGGGQQLVTYVNGKLNPSWRKK